MASFHEDQFPVTLSWGAKGGPGFNTSLKEIASGFEQRDPNWTAHRYAFDVSHLIKDPASIAQLLAFFYMRRGRAYGFRFKDHNDFQAINEPIVESAAGSGVWMCAKYYADPANPYTRLISKPCSGTVTDASGYTPPAPIASSGTIDPATGIVSGSGAGRTWTGEFDVPVRFNVDAAQIALNAWNDANWEGIQLVEIRNWPA